MSKNFEQLKASHEQVSMRIAERLISLQQRLAQWLNQRLSKLKPASQRILLYVVCWLFGIYFLTVAILAIN